MLRLGAIGFLFLYLLTGVNLQVGIHACGGQMKNWRLFESAEKCHHAEVVPKESKPCRGGCKAEDESKGKCCSDIYIISETHDEHHLTDSYQDFDQIDLPLTLPQVSFSGVTNQFRNHVIAKPPNPPPKSTSRHVLFCSYMI